MVAVTTGCGYQLRGTAIHRVKVLDQSGAWVWRRLADIEAGDTIPLALGKLLGEATKVELAPLGETMSWAAQHHLRVPVEVDAELAELVGYFMGQGSLHSKGLRFYVASADDDVAIHLQLLAKSLFGIEAKVFPKSGHLSVEFDSVRLSQWLEACGFAKRRLRQGHDDQGCHPVIPDALLRTNSSNVYAAFLRGLFEAEGTVTLGYPSWTTATVEFASEVQSLMLALGFVTTRSAAVSRRGSTLAVVRLLNRASNEHRASNERWLEEVGFISARKHRAVNVSECPQSEPGHPLGVFYDRVVSVELGEEELTYDLSVPDNLTYIANGFVSHNTIGLLMDCDTTGIEPDLGLVKTKKLVGGGT
ncbi:MAG: LAGLIDADG family homing endonuclease, partial [Pseudonocardiaceae bacterium]